MTTALAAVILANNEAHNIQDCIVSVQWTDRVVVFESFSEDDTAARAREAGAEVIQHAFENYANQRNAALEAVDADWIFFVDADERSSEEQAAEIRAAIAHPGHHGYWIPRHNYIFGKLTRYAGWYPDYQMRLLHREHARYDPQRPVHELVIIEGEPGYLLVPLIHYNYVSVAQFHAKQRRYAQYDAQILKETGIQPKPHKFLTQPLRQFVWRYITLRGFRDGWHGFRLSLLMAWYEAQKYRYLRELYASEQAN